MSEEKVIETIQGSTLSQLSLKLELTDEERLTIIEYWLKQDAINISHLFTEHHYNQLMEDSKKLYSIYDVYNMFCISTSNSIDYAKYMKFVRLFTRFFYSEHNIVIFKDIHIYTGALDMYKFEFMNYTIKAINNFVSKYNSNRKILENIISSMSYKETAVKIQAGADIVDVSDAKVYYTDIESPISMQYKAPRVLAIIDLSEEARLVSFGVAKLDDLTNGGEMPDMQYFTTIDMETEDLFDEYTNLANVIFNSYSDSLNSIYRYMAVENPPVEN